MSTELTLEEKACNFETMQHIHRVGKNLNIIVRKLLTRGENHDASKLESPEVAAFTEYTPKLATCTYGSTEYNEFKKGLGDALVHHYANNSHHPEHHPRGLRGMDLVDLIELYCDWAASCKRHNDGNLNNSIKINAVRFGMNNDLVEIFENSVYLFEDA